MEKKPRNRVKDMEKKPRNRIKDMEKSSTKHILKGCKVEYR